MAIPAILAAVPALAAGAVRFGASLLGGGGAAQAAGRAVAIAAQGRRVGSMAAMAAKAAGGSRGQVKRAAQIGQQIGEDHAAKKQNALERLWTAQSALDLYERVAEKWTPSFAHTIRVSVVGGPDADIRRIWYLCLAAAFGRYERRARGYQGAQIDCSWDITGKAVSVEISYVNNGLNNVFSFFGETNGLNLIQEGPTQITIGGYWPDWLRRTLPDGVFKPPLNLTTATAAGLLNPAAIVPVVGAALVNEAVVAFGNPPTGGFASALFDAVAQSLTPGAGETEVDILRENADGSGKEKMSHGSTVTLKGGPPDLPDSGRVITTGEKGNPKVQPPRPHLDSNTRNSLVGLVAAWLGEPGIAPKKPPATAVPLTPSKGVGLASSATPVPGAAGKVPAQTTRPDGYPRGPYFLTVPTGFRV